GSGGLKTDFPGARADGAAVEVNPGSQVLRERGNGLFQFGKVIRVRLESVHRTKRTARGFQEGGQGVAVIRSAVGEGLVAEEFQHLGGKVPRLGSRIGEAVEIASESPPDLGQVLAPRTLVGPKGRGL